MSENPIVKLQFMHRFRNGTLCKMTFHLLPNGIPSQPHYIWSGPLPKLRGERLDWELSCFSTIAERIGAPTFYGAYLCTGKIKTWRCDPGKKPKSVPFAELVEDGALILTAHNVHNHGNTWPQ
jgi:hypothetical protein